jgi:hypothetical protein
MEKYTSFSMRAIENAEHLQSEKLIQALTPKKERLSASECKVKFYHIEELFALYIESDRLSDQYRLDVASESYKLRQNLRK